MVEPLIVCPLCRSDDIEILANIPAMVLCRCRNCRTAFTIVPPAPQQPS
jgi:hypothetical protein